MDSITPWVKHLNDPLILSGFVLFILAGLLKLLNMKKITRDATKNLMHKGLNFVFALGLLIVLLGFGVKWMELQNESSNSRSASAVVQSMSNTSGISTQSGRDSNINVGQGNLFQSVKEDATVTLPTSLSQKIENTEGISTQSGRDSNSQSQ